MTTLGAVFQWHRAQPHITRGNTMREFNNDASWKNAFSSMFGAIKMRDCTPATVLETMLTMPRSVNPLVEIVIAARSRNIRASDEEVLDCLRQLYREGKIEHRCVGEKDFFIRPKK